MKAAPPEYTKGAASKAQTIEISSSDGSAAGDMSATDAAGVSSNRPAQTN